MPAKKIEVIEKVKRPDILDRLSIYKDYIQYIVQMDISDVVPFSKFNILDSIYNKMGIIIRKNFGILGYYWGYGSVYYDYPEDYSHYPLVSAPVSINIYFPTEVNQKWLEDYREVTIKNRKGEDRREFRWVNAIKFEKIYKYIKDEYNAHYGILGEDDDEVVII